MTLLIPRAPGTNPNNMFMYTVKAGDSLYSIARRYNTTYQAIMNLNYLTSPNLYIGQVLRIPEMYTKEEEMMLPQFINYVVKRGDTLYSIARDNNVDINTLMKDNALVNNNLTIGQVLKIRTPKIDSGFVEECFGEDYEPSISNDYVTYTVVNGDSLYSIARKFNTSVSEIMMLNNLNSTGLSIGQQLKIPNSNNSSNSTQFYTVKKGDTLYSIANLFNTTVNSIKTKNNLISNSLSVGQKIKI